MPLHLLKSWLLPLVILLVVNVLAAGWRAIPPSGKQRDGNNDWQSLQELASGPDVRSALLAGKYWGDVQITASTDDDSIAAIDTPQASVSALSKHIQSQLQGIIRRGEWVLLFANPQGDSDDKKAVPLPLELRSGDVLPNTNWQIGDIWPDRIQLTHSGNEPLIVPLYPLAEPTPEQ